MRPGRETNGVIPTRGLRRILEEAEAEHERQRGGWYEDVARERVERLRIILREREGIASTRDNGRTRLRPLCAYCLGPMTPTPSEHYATCDAYAIVENKPKGAA